MRALVFLVTVVGVVGQIPVRAQVPDFSGIYAGARTIIEPDVYPFTTEGERAHGVYDPLTRLEIQSRRWRNWVAKISRRQQVSLGCSLTATSW